MKKILIFVLVLFLGIGIYFSYARGLFPSSPKRNHEVPAEISVSRVTVVVDDSKRISTYSAIPGRTVFEALQYLERTNIVQMKTKQYDFGVFIEELGGKANTTDRAWLYFVNGVSGDSAADKKEVHDGDHIEWRYMKPSF